MPNPDVGGIKPIITAQHTRGTAITCMARSMHTTAQPKHVCVCVHRAGVGVLVSDAGVRHVGMVGMDRMYIFHNCNGGSDRHAIIE